MLGAVALGGRGLQPQGVRGVGAEYEPEAESGGGEEIGRHQRVQSVPAPLGGGADVWLAYEAAAPGEGLRGDGGERGGVDLRRHHTDSGPEAGQTWGCLTFQTGSK